MAKWRVWLNSVIVCSLLLLIACRFDPLGNRLNDGVDYLAAVSPNAPTPEQIEQIVDDLKSQKAVLPAALEAPAYSFYRFDYTNATGGHRLATILSHAQAVASPAFGVESTARVLAYEAMLAKTGYPFDFFRFSEGLSTARLEPVVTAIALKFADADFLLNSPEPIGSTTLVAKAVADLVGGLPLPEGAEFKPLPIASPAVQFALKPDFSTLPTTTLTGLIANPELQTMLASISTTGLANYSLFTSNIPATSQPRAAIRGHNNNTGNHNIDQDYFVSLAPVGGIGSVTNLVTYLPQTASAQLVVSPAGNDQKIVFTFLGNHQISQVFRGTITQLRLKFHLVDYYDDCHRSDTTGPTTTFLAAGTDTLAISKSTPPNTIAELVCAVLVDNRAIATFSATSGATATVVLPIPAEGVATLACYLVPPAEATAVEASIRDLVAGELKTGERALTDLESQLWTGALRNASDVALPGSGRTLKVPSLFQDWFQPKGPYAYQQDVTEFTPQVFRELAAPAAPTTTIDMSGYSQTPLFAFAIPFSLQPIIKGIASGAYNKDQTFSVSGGGSYAYTLNDGATWIEYTGPVTLKAEGVYRLKIRNTLSSYVSPLIPVTIDRTPPAHPVLTGISSGTFSEPKTITMTGEPDGTIQYLLRPVGDYSFNPITYSGPFTVASLSNSQLTWWQYDAAGNSSDIPLWSQLVFSIRKSDFVAPPTPTIVGIASGVFPVSQVFTIVGSETGGILVYSLDGGQTPATYTGPVTLSESGKTYQVVAWQQDRSENVSSRTAVIRVTIDTSLPAAPVVSGIASGTFTRNQTFSLIASETGGFLYYSLDGGVTAATYSAPVTLSERSQEYKVVAWQRSAAGNVGPRTPVIALTIDTTPPLPPTIAGISSGTFSSSQTFTVSGNEAGGLLAYSLDGGATLATYTTPVTIAEIGRTYQIVAWHRDAVGQVSSPTATITVTLAAQPAVTAISPTTGGNVGSPLNVQISGSGFTAGAVPRLTRADRSPVIGTAVTVPSATTLTCSFALNGLATGAWNVEVTNPSGLTGTGTGMFSVFAPAVTIAGVTPATGINTGIVTGVQITGTGFGPGIVPRLTRAGSAPVTGSAVEVSAATALTCSFDLTGLQHAVWNVELTNAEGFTATAANVFTVRSQLLTKHFGGTGDEANLYCVAADGGGYLLAGTTPSSDGDITGSKGGEDVWVAKLDEAGTVLWSKCIGGSGNDRCTGLIAISGGCVFAGSTTSTDGDLTGIEMTTTTLSDGTHPGNTRTGNTQQAWICRLDASGAVFWQRLFGMTTVPGNATTYSSDARGGLLATGGEYVFAGTARADTYEYAWCCRIDSWFMPVWVRTLGAGSGQAYGNGVAQRSNGNFLFCGSTDLVDGDFSGTGSAGQWNDGFVFELTSAGALVPGKAKCFGGTGVDSCSSVVPLADGGFYVVGTTEGGGTCPATRGGADVMLLRGNADYSLAWAKTFGGANAEQGVKGVLAADGGLLFAGSTASTDGDVTANHGATNDFWFGKTDSAGNLLWQNCFGGPDHDILTDFMTTSGGGYVLSGYGISIDMWFAGAGVSSGNSNFLFIKDPSLQAP